MCPAVLADGWNGSSVGWSPSSLELELLWAPYGEPRAEGPLGVVGVGRGRYLLSFPPGGFGFGVCLLEGVFRVWPLQDEGGGCNPILASGRGKLQT